MTNRQAIKKAEFQALNAWAWRPRLSIKTCWLDTRVSALRRVGSTTASQQQGALAQWPRLSCNYPNYGASHRTYSGKWPLIRERFQEARSPPETPINSPICHAGRGRRWSSADNQIIERGRINQGIINRERRLFSKHTAYKLLFAYLFL